MAEARTVHLTPHGLDARAHTAGDLTLSADARIAGAYLHIPFCFHKCHYCDFYSFVDTRDRQGPFIDRLVEELGAFADRFGRPAMQTIFVGGGTPTLLTPTLWRTLAAGLHAHLPLMEDGEFTVEANPETVTDELCATLAHVGVNRVSIGAQSFHPAHLKTLERWHDPENVPRSVERFRRAGIDNINLDLIFAIPGQTLDDWLADLRRALSLHPAHLSCYSLTYEPNTALTARWRAGTVVRAEEDLEAAMYEATIDLLGQSGYEQYEISNWALSGRECRHNLLYWRNEHWWAFGPSASGHVAGTRWKNVPRVDEYLAVSPWPRVVDVERLDAEARIGETLMMRLRLLEGIPEVELDHLLRQGREERRNVLAQHETRGNLERKDGRVRLSSAGLLVADSVMADLL